jgi:hypothetical protein
MWSQFVTKGILIRLLSLPCLDSPALTRTHSPAKALLPFHSSAPIRLPDLICLSFKPGPGGIWRGG